MIADFVNTVMQPRFLFALMAAVSVFATILTILIPLLTRDRTAQRMKVMAVERNAMRAERLAQLAQSNRSGGLRHKPKGYMKQIVDQLDLRSKFDNEELRHKLKMAGFRGQSPVVTYMFFRVAMPIIMFFVALFYVFVLAKLSSPPMIKVLIALGIGLLGYYMPNVYISNAISKRQASIKLAFPDSLDMLLICVQSGMSVEAAFGKVAAEATKTSLELAEEMQLTSAELNFLPERRMAFENLGKRTGIPGVKAVATALIQAERYGTPVSQALRVMAQENRDIRMGEAEAKAAALPPKLTVPMIIFFLPVLFLVILGPVAISVWHMN